MPGVLGRRRRDRRCGHGLVAAVATSLVPCSSAPILGRVVAAVVVLIMRLHRYIPPPACAWAGDPVAAGAARRPFAGRRTVIRPCLSPAQTSQTLTG